jgi:hypothetical protein
MAEEKPALDLNLIPFPSDKITIGQVRREQPELFDDPLEFSRTHMDAFNIGATIRDELVLVDNAFAGRQDRQAEDERREILHRLNDDYCRYGVSSGMQQTQQLVRDMEAAAQRQAGTGRA